MRIFWFAAILLLPFPIGFQWLKIAPESRIESTVHQSKHTNIFDEDIKPGAEQLFKYIDFVKGKKIGLVVNQTSMIGNTHLVDTLRSLGCNIQKIFAPEHGFRGTADRGEHIKDDLDPDTGIKIVSLYGKNLRPGPDLMGDLDLVIFDIQDVGVRFYTFTSTMSYMMEACAENKVPMLVLDRPNPLGHCVDGPVMQDKFKSFVGLHPVPVIHGLTTAEYARMINEEGWLRNGLTCELYHVECLNYNHRKFYKLPIKPSPNLPNMHSIYLYPSLCLFEGTDLSVGRGTHKQFQVYGHPDFKKGKYHFTPQSMEGAKSPVQMGKNCQGFDLSGVAIEKLQQECGFYPEYLIDFYQQSDAALRAKFFQTNDFFNKLVGNADLKAAVLAGKSAAEIKKGWEKELTAYKQLRRKYLLYAE